MQNDLKIINLSFNTQLSLHHSKLVQSCTGPPVSFLFHSLVIHEQDSEIFKLLSLGQQLFFFKMFIQLFKCYIYLGQQLYLICYFCFSIPEGTGVILSKGDDPPFDDEDYSQYYYYFFTYGEINSTLIINDTEVPLSLLSGNICLLCSMSIVLICKYLYMMLTPNILYF